MSPNPPTPPSETPLFTPPPKDTRGKDNENLKLLVIFHFSFAGIYLTAAAALIIRYLTPSGMDMQPTLADPSPTMTPANGSLPQIFETMNSFYLAMGIIVLGFAVLQFFCGLSLLKRKNRIFCLVVSALNCLNLPIGTALGVFTIIMLTKPSVIAAYAQADRQSPSS